MTEDNKHWTSKVKVFLGVAPNEIEKTLNDFYKDKFVIATQLFPWDLNNTREYQIVVYYKVPPKAESPSKADIVGVQHPAELGQV